MTRLTQKSFTGGELAPALYARNDLAKYSNGLKKLQNGFVRAEGCISNSAGLEMICEVKDSSKKTRIIPFAFNTEQTYIIELGNKYARFIKDGGQIVHPSGDDKAGQIVETETPYASEDLFMLKYGQNADVLTICNNNYAPRELSRTSHYNWLLEEVISAAQINPPTGLSATWTGDTKENTTTSNFKGSPAHEWLVNNAYKYGFIQRYEEDTEELTGFAEEAWHWRYVGVEVATYLHEHNITFDEYYAYFILNG